MAYGKTYTTIDNSKASAASDSTKLPITAGTDTYVMTSEGKGDYNDWKRWQFNVVFYDSSDEVITPTAGDIQITVAQDETLVWRSIVGGDIVAVDVYSDASEVSIPYVAGSIYAYRVIFDSVTGTDMSYAKVIAVAQK